MTPDAPDLLLPEQMTLDAAVRALASQLELQEGAAETTELRFYDTFDCLVRDCGLSLVFDGGRIALVDRASGEERAGAPVSKPPERLLAIELEPSPLRDALLPVVDVRALLPIVHVRSRVRAFGVLDDAAKTIVRLVLAEPVVVASANRTIQLRPRVRLVAVRGYSKALARVRRTLEDQLGLRPAGEPLVDEAVGATGADPGGTQAKIDVRFEFGERSDAAAGAILKRLVEVMEANLEGTIADVDAEFLHDFRVAVRRSRAVQRELKRVFPPGELARFRTELRWLQQVTGPARDLDVYVLDFDEFRLALPEDVRLDLDPLLRVIKTRRVTARREMVRALRSDRASKLLTDWPSFLDKLVALGDDDRQQAARPIGGLAGERIDRVYNRMVRMGGAIEDSSPPEALHELRKKGKELRYLLELFGTPLYPSDVVKPMVKTLKSLQDTLGRHQDREVQVATLRSLRDEVSALPGGAPALMAMGLLIERLHEDTLAARAEFAVRFAAFASKSQRELVKDTFG